MSESAKKQNISYIFNSASKDAQNVILKMKMLHFAQFSSGEFVHSLKMRQCKRFDK